MNDVRLFKLGMAAVLTVLAAFLVLHNLQRQDMADGLPPSAMNPPLHPAPNLQGPIPSPHLSPEEVVRIQLESMRDNEPPENQGIAIAFRFASPQNRQATGPLPRFVELVNTPAYKPLLEHDSVEYGQLLVRQGVAEQLVTLKMPDGSVTHYVFLLQLQTHPKVFRCWMTEGVMPLQETDQWVPEEPEGIPI